MTDVRLQGDTSERVVYLDNLEAMCERVSGVTHWYRVDRVTRARVYIMYSNPDEYGANQPFMAVFPLFPAKAGDKNRDNPRVILSMIDTVHEPGNYYGEGWQAFDSLLSCPILWKNPNTGDWTATAKCQNCGERFLETDLLPVKDRAQRIEAGEPVPRGECPKCGTVCHVEGGD